MNQLWRDITKLKQGAERASWEGVLMPGCAEPVYQEWERMIREKRPVTFQSQIDTQWLAPELDAAGNEQFDVTHILVSLYPDLNENGEIVTVMSCITDISGLKWTEKQLTRRMDQAIEMKKQQERFIDMTSHEMRNPLSALIGCADEIISALRECCRITRNAEIYATNSFSNGLQQEVNLLTESLENADIIIYCALHQKRSKCYDVLSADQFPPYYQVLAA
jgi:signal transduction histidine kinase